MLFSSITFLFYFFPAVLFWYYLFRRSYPIKNGVLLIASLFFYAWGEPWFVLIMLASILGNYILALFVDKYRLCFQYIEFFIYFILYFAYLRNHICIFIYSQRVMWIT